MSMENKSPKHRYEMERDMDRLRIIIAPFKNYWLFKAIIFLLLLFMVSIILLMLIPILIISVTPIGLFLNNLLIIIIVLLLLPAAIMALMYFIYTKNRIIIDLTKQGITTINDYGLIKRESNYLSENIKNIRLSENSSWGAISFDYGTTTIDICQSLSEDDAKQILSAIGEQFPQYKPEMEAGKLSKVERKFSRLQSLGISFLIICLIGGFGTLVVLDPDIQKTSILSLGLLWTVTIAIGVSSYLNSQKRSWLYTFIMQFGLTALLLAYSIQTIKTFASGWFWIVPLVGAYLLAWILPMLNPQMAKALNDEQKRLGQKLKTAGMIVFSGLIVIGTMIPKEDPIYTVDRILLGLLFAILAICGGQILAYQIWDQRRQEKQGSNSK